MDCNPNLFLSIYVMERGKITEEGTFDELYDKKGYFHELVSRQMIAEKLG